MHTFIIIEHTFLVLHVLLVNGSRLSVSERDR